MNAAYALLMDWLYPGRGEFAKPYRRWEHFGTAEKLFSVWQELRRDWHPGDEYHLVDEFARILELQDLYEWRSDDDINRKAILESVRALNVEETNWDKEFATAPQGPTNPELLKEKEPATVMYLLNTLERFDKMTDAQIQQLGMEVGVIGMEGIDYTSADKRHAVRAFPGETFSGLQLLCFMYAAFNALIPRSTQD